VVRSDGRLPPRAADRLVAGFEGRVQVVPPSDAAGLAELESAVDLWSTFPVSQSTRPLLLGSPVFDTRGFTTGDARVASMTGDGLLADSSIPAEVGDALRMAG